MNSHIANTTFIMFFGCLVSSDLLIKYDKFNRKPVCKVTN